MTRRAFARRVIFYPGERDKFRLIFLKDVVYYFPYKSILFWG